MQTITNFSFREHKNFFSAKTWGNHFLFAPRPSIRGTNKISGQEHSRRFMACAEKIHFRSHLFPLPPPPPPLSQSLLPSPCSSSSSGIKEERVCVRACVRACACVRERERGLHTDAYWYHFKKATCGVGVQILKCFCMQKIIINKGPINMLGA